MNMVVDSRMLLLLGLVRFTCACDVCDGLSAKKLKYGQVLDISDEGLTRLTAEHDLIFLLLYKSWDDRSDRLATAFDRAAASIHRSGGGAFVMAQLDADAFRAVAPTLHVSSVELPTIRVLRGDVRFGYPLRSGNTASEIEARLRFEVDQPGTVVARLDAASLDELQPSAVPPGKGTRVIGHLTSPQSVRAFEQVAHAFRGVIHFMLPESPEPAVPPPSSPPSLPPAPSESPSSMPPPSPPSTPPPQLVHSSERLVLLRESSEDMAGEPPSLELRVDVASGGCRPHRPSRPRRCRLRRLRPRLRHS